MPLIQWVAPTGAPYRPKIWVELPWGEQLLTGSEFEFEEYSTQITPDSEEITLFIRSWNKWPIQSLAEYTLDGISLTGPIPGSTTMVPVMASAETEARGDSTAGAGESSAGGESGSGDSALIDQPLPITGLGDANGFLGDGRFWGAIMVIVALVIGAVYRARWRW